MTYELEILERDSKLIRNALDKNKPILASDYKTHNFEYINRDMHAIYQFIQFNSDYHISSISVDIDYKINLNSLYELGIPTPTFTVTTPNGYHLHWFLKDFIAVSNKKALKYVTNIRASLVYLLKADKQAAGFKRVWRNPLNHEGNSNGILYRLSDFSNCLVKVPKAKTNYRRTANLGVDFTEVREGERHQTMFEHLRAFAYGLEKDNWLEDNLLMEAEEKNSLMPRGLPDHQIKSLVKSVTNWTMNNYNPRKGEASKETIEFNRKLAKQQADKTIQKIVKSMFSMMSNFFSVKNLKALSQRKASKILGVSAPTFKKYKEMLLEFIMIAIQNMKNLSETQLERLMELVLLYVSVFVERKEPVSVVEIENKIRQLE